MSKQESPHVPRILTTPLERVLSEEHSEQLRWRAEAEADRDYSKHRAAVLTTALTDLLAVIATLPDEASRQHIDLEAGMAQAVLDAAGGDQG